MFLSQRVWCCVILSVVALLSVTWASNYSCPTWFYYSNTTQRCECGFEAGWLVCDQQTMIVQVNREFIVTYSGEDGLFYVGRRPLNIKFNNTNRMFSRLPTDPDLLQGTVCGPYNRKGLICEQCIDGYGPGVYTLGSQCADCSKFSPLSASLLYLLVYIVPITLFFLSVWCYFGSTSPLVHCLGMCSFVKYSQFLLNTTQPYIITFSLNSHQSVCGL